jgi:glycosyltransferase involved in cell wall biosynthesis
MKRKYRIALVGGGHVASTPRLVKEADVLHSQGYEVVALGVETVPSVSVFDNELQRVRPWRLMTVNMERRGLFSRAWMRWRRSRLERDLPSCSLEMLGEVTALGRGALLAEIDRFAPDLVIAHSIAALTVAALARERFGISYAFDMEDYHPGECPGDSSAPANRVAFEVLNRCLKGARYVTAASPGIAEEAERVFNVKGIVPILNSFPLRDLPSGPSRERHPGGLSLYWFSQTLGLDRGIPEAIAACGHLRGEVQLHLRGSVSPAVQRQIQSLIDQAGVSHRCHLHGWCHPDEMIERAAEHDVGLALENKQTWNRDLAISNKILAYPLAGLAVVATRTRGQTWVMDQMPEAGFMYEVGDVKGLAEGLQRWVDDPGALRSARLAARTAAESRFCWEKEAPRFLETVERALETGGTSS